MKIAIAAESNDSESLVFTHAARAPYYLFYDDNGMLIEAIENPYSSVDRGAAPRVAQLLQEYGVGTLVAGQFGERFSAQLEERNISTVLGKGPAFKMIQELSA